MARCHTLEHKAGGARHRDRHFDVQVPSHCIISDEGYVVPGWSSYRECERATISWQRLRSVVLERYGLEFAEDLEAVTRTAATNPAVPRATTQKSIGSVQPKAAAR